MSNDTVAEFCQPAAFADALTKLLREKAYNTRCCVIEDKVAGNFAGFDGCQK